jgi:hypothetical protein
MGKAGKAAVHRSVGSPAANPTPETLGAQNLDVNIGPVGPVDERELAISGLKLNRELAAIASDANRYCAYVDPQTGALKRSDDVRQRRFGERQKG